MKIVLDCDKCQGHAMCAAQAPEVYELDDTGYNRMSEFTVVEGQEEAARLGASWCPEDAITLIECCSMRTIYSEQHMVTGPKTWPVRFEFN